MNACTDILSQEVKKRIGKPKGPLSAIESGEREKIQKARSVKKLKTLKVNDLRLSFLIAKRTLQLEELVDESEKNNKSA